MPVITERFIMKKNIFIFLILAILLFCSSCGTNNMQSYLNRMMSTAEFSGVVMVTQNGKTVGKATRGVENNVTRQSITTDTLFCIGSVSKQFTAAAILLLQQDGKLRVDENLTRFFPNYTFGEMLTIRHLLDMRSGIAEFYDVEYIDDAFTELPTSELRSMLSNDHTIAENQQTLENWLMKQPLLFEPDTEYMYSNSNYFLLARIVEIASGEKFNNFVRSRIFQPLGMKHSTFIDDVDFITTPHLAVPSVNTQTVYVGVTMGLGDMISNAPDIDRWLTSLRDHTLLSDDSMTMMTTDYTDDENNYGFGVQLYDDAVYHYGYFTTYMTMVYTNMQTGVNVFVVTNDAPHIDPDITYIGWTLISYL